jgi:hypothetical protein
MKRFIKICHLVLFISVIVLATQATAQQSSLDELMLTEKGKAAYQTLLKVDLFAIGGIGYGGSTSEGEEALDVLLDEKKAVNAFRSLVTSATPEGGLYALFGLRALKCECFKEEVENYKSLPEPPERKTKFGIIVPARAVKRMSGCLGFSQQRLEVTEEIESGKWAEVWTHLKTRRVATNHRFVRVFFSYETRISNHSHP